MSHEFRNEQELGRFTRIALSVDPVQDESGQIRYPDVDRVLRCFAGSPRRVRGARPVGLDTPYNTGVDEEVFREAVRSIIDRYGSECSRNEILYVRAYATTDTSGRSIGLGKFDPPQAEVAEEDEDESVGSASLIQKLVDSVVAHAKVTTEHLRELGRQNKDLQEGLINASIGMLDKAQEMGRLETQLALQHDRAGREAIAQALENSLPAILETGERVIMGTAIIGALDKPPPLDVSETPRPEGFDSERIRWNIAAIRALVLDIGGVKTVNESAMTDEIRRLLAELITEVLSRASELGLEP